MQDTEQLIDYFIVMYLALLSQPLHLCIQRKHLKLYISNPGNFNFEVMFALKCGLISDSFSHLSFPQKHVPKSLSWTFSLQGAVHKRCRNFLAVFDTPLPHAPCRNFDPDLPNSYLLISCNIRISNPLPLKYSDFFCVCPQADMLNFLYRVICFYKKR